MTTPTPDSDTWSPRTMRIFLAVCAAGLGAAAWQTHSWLRQLLATVAVLCLCAAIIPPFRKGPT